LMPIMSARSKNQKILIKIIIVLIL